MPVFSGNDLARTGVALIYQEVLENIGRDVGVAGHTAILVKLLSHIGETRLVCQSEIIKIDGRLIGHYFADHPEAMTNSRSISELKKILSSTEREG